MKANRLFLTLKSFIYPPVLFISKIALSLATGIMLALAYPPGPAPWLSWIAFIPVLFAMACSSFAQSAIFGFVSGVTYYSAAFQWIYAFHPLALPAMSIVQALLFFTTPLLFIRLLLRFRLALFIAGPAVWVLFEQIKLDWFLSFPFGTLGYSQYGWTRFIQIADLGGAAIVSLLIVLANLVIFWMIVDIPLLLNRKRIIFAYASLLALLFGIPLLYGSIRFGSLKYNPEERLKAGFAQTRFHPKATWEDNKEKYFSVFESMAESLSGLGADIVLFPECSIDRPLTLDPGISLSENAEIFNRLSALARTNKTNLLIGSLEYKLSDSKNTLERLCFNTMYLFTETGELKDIYRKQALVPFGEFYPFDGLFPDLRDYIASTTDSAFLSKGKTSTVFTIPNGKGENISFGLLICFESASASLAAEYARKGADFLVNATNDYWSLSATAMYQHAVMAVFRAVEIRRPVLRISNGGFSCVVDELGRYSSTLGIFKEGTATAVVKLLEKPGITVYVLAGDIIWAFIALCLAVGLVIAIFTGLKRDAKR